MRSVGGGPLPTYSREIRMAGCRRGRAVLECGGHAAALGLLGMGMQALAEAIALGEKAGLEKGLLLEVLEQTAVL
jgi:3-hydroxyisobutyrate dehydrogenase-like beta-hydroxyacid dehydrogenase